MAFVVLHFLLTDDVTVASSQWLNSDKTTCMWPPYEEITQVKRAALEHKKPELTWSSHEIAVIGSYPNYLSAEISCRKALDISSLNADELDTEQTEQEKFFPSYELQNSSPEENPPKKVRMIYPSSVTLPLIDEATSQHSADGSVSENCTTSEQRFKSCDLSPFEAESTACEKQILMTLKEVLNQQQEQNLLLQQLLPTSFSVGIDSYMPKLPVDSFVQLDEWEAFLDDDSSFKAAVKYLETNVGGDIGQSTRRILSSIMTNKLAANFNWAGKGSKRSFRCLRCVRLILCTLKDTFWHKNITIMMVENFIKDWLKHAPTRYRYSEIKKEANLYMSSM